MLPHVFVHNTNTDLSYKPAPETPTLCVRKQHSHTCMSTGAGFCRSNFFFSGKHKATHDSFKKINGIRQSLTCFLVFKGYVI